MGKLYEKVILNRLENELGGKEGNFQHAYRRGHSTVTALLEVQRQISEALDEDYMVAVYSMDLSAAFDMLRPGQLFQTLKDMNISIPLSNMLMDFLHQRRIYVEVDEQKSQEVDMPIGCVQGSILGPRLFTLYLSNLQEKLNYPVISYADDSYVVVRAKIWSP